MSDRILVVTAPDDTLLDGIRILHVDLNSDQTQHVSSALLGYELHDTIINYVWRQGDPIQWLMDKKSKSDAILFNADTESNDLIVGYFAAHPNSYYFGNLRDLHLVNDRVILNTDSFLNLLKTLTNTRN